jgi:predicted lipoprotein with Yx(FWY)xxD motif
MFRFVIVAAAVLLSAGEVFAHGSEAAAPPPPQQETWAVPVKLAQTSKGRVFTDSRGMTLYYFDRDDTGKTSTCDGKCAERWIPLAADKTAKASGDFTVIVRSDGSLMWAHRYRPLYTSNADKAPGDVNGFDAQNLWHIARPPSP